MKINIRDLEQCEDMPQKGSMSASMMDFWGDGRQWNDNYMGYSGARANKVMTSLVGKPKEYVDTRIKRMLAEQHCSVSLETFYEFRIETDPLNHVRGGYTWFNEEGILEEVPYTGKAFSQYRKGSKPDKRTNKEKAKDLTAYRQENRNDKKLRKLWLIPDTKTIRMQSEDKVYAAVSNKKWVKVPVTKHYAAERGGGYHTFAYKGISVNRTVGKPKDFYQNFFEYMFENYYSLYCDAYKLIS